MDIAGGRNMGVGATSPSGKVWGEDLREWGIEGGGKRREGSFVEPASDAPE